MKSGSLLLEREPDFVTSLGMHTHAFLGALFLLGNGVDL